MDFSIDTDQAVAYGAAVHAAQLQGRLNVFDLPEHVLKDITPISLGFGSDTLCKYMKVVIPRNSVLPFKKTVECTTIKDNQEFIFFRIHQGEHVLADKNFLLGEFRLVGLPKGPKGSVNVKVTFAINENGLMKMFAKDLATGTSNGITIKSVTDQGADNRLQKMIRRAMNYSKAEPMRQQIRLTRDKLQNDVEILIEKISNMQSKLPRISDDEQFKRIKEIRRLLRGNLRKEYDQDKAMAAEVQGISVFYNEMDRTTQGRRGRSYDFKRY